MNYTTIEQSKKLIELGLDKNGADMYYPEYDFFLLKTPLVMDGDFYHDSDVPCWSLGALLEIMPEEIKYEDINCNLELAKDWISYEGCDRYDASYRIQPMAFYGEPLMELAFNTVCWLLENNYIKKGE